MSTTEPTTQPRPVPILGTDIPAPEAPASAHTIVVIDKTSPGTWTGNQLRDTVWSARYSALFFMNRSAWVEHGYCDAIADVKLLSPTPVPGIPTVSEIPAGAWIAELADTSDQPGAIGYHEGQARVTKAGPSGAHTERGIALHPATAEETVLMRTFVKTAREDNAPVTEVFTHELNEAAVDPYVNNDSELRVYTNPADGYEYIGEVGDPVQGRAFDVGAPEGRPCGVPEALVSDFAEPAWWEQPQTRSAICFTQDASQWKTLPSIEQIKAWEVGQFGYMSRRKPGGQFEQIQGERAPNIPDPQ